MTFIVNRRAAFGFLGAGSLTFLTACSGLNINSPTSDISGNDQTKEPEKDYRGEVKLESYDTSAGTYRPATRTQPPKNVPNLLSLIIFVRSQRRASTRLLLS